ncbi:uncharacterized protein LOC141683421 [Apium graveolens]|uniref:uncharacterized protein LOC141683421 n=1 Tax=Apium graveolens TaxID=4045 RepID=UPI003D79F4C4
MASTSDLEMQLAGLDIDDEENEQLVFDEEIEEEINRFELCLVGRFLTEKSINVRVMKTKLADIWRPAMGITIKDLKPGLFLFQFYHIDDLKWVVNGGPWSFDSALLVLNVIKPGEDPTKVALFEVDFWIQIHDLPVGYMSEAVGKQLGNFFGSFIQYDSNNNSSIWRDFLRLRVRVDVRKPLKRKKKICKKDKSEVIIHCKYEKLGDFCFIFGLLSHTERFCKKKFEGEGTEITNEWNGWLRALPRRGGGGSKSRWLRDENDGEWDKHKEQFSGESFPKNKSVTDMQLTMRGKSVNQAVISEQTGGASHFSNLKGGKFCSPTNGPEEEEMDGLLFEERKRQRSEAVKSPNEISNKVTNIESVFSQSDYTESSTTILAKLAQQQASHSK